MCSSSSPKIDTKTAEEKAKEAHDAEAAELVLGSDDGGVAASRKKKARGMRMFMIPLDDATSSGSGIQIE